MKFYYPLLAIALLFSCGEEEENCDGCDPSSVEAWNEPDSSDLISPVDAPSLVILGTFQDAGSPQINCHKECCEHLHHQPDPDRMVVCLGLIDPENRKKYLIEATPDMPRQLELLHQNAGFNRSDVPDGVLLTHAHIGHYSGLMYFGKEAMDASNIPVYTMPKMTEFLQTNGPWDQLVENENIKLNPIEKEKEFELTSNFKIIPFIVPHRDEYSETVGFKIIGPNKSALFIPDIDKWSQWDKKITKELETVDYAFIDGTFYDSHEISGSRDVCEIPHPFITESFETFRELSDEERRKVIFIHFNHTNPVIEPNSEEYEELTNKGFKVARIHQIYRL
ncbi:MAG: MBL fold metallo-hydrolase [Crocinitomicaceae bacterium]|nr:MBL fold metallo-hydrolase [Crocinitomicaceae bacterium]